MARRFVVAALVVTCLSPELSGQSLMDRGTPRVYEGKNLEAVLMPIGGIGAGNVWLAGTGELSGWQIFANSLARVGVPDSFLAVRAKAEGEKPVVKTLQTSPREGFPALESVSFRGDYPIAWLTFADKELPVQVSLKAYNPMIPLDARDSALPCAIFEITAENTRNTPVEVSLAAALQNEAGQDGAQSVRGRKSSCFGGNQNVFLKKPGGCEVLLSVPSQQGSSLAQPRSLLYAGWEPGRLQTCANLTVVGLPDREAAPQADLAWIEGARAETPAALKVLNRIAAEGGKAVLSMPRIEFVRNLAELRKSPADRTPVVFEDFEKPTYEGWKVEGTAFGAGPAHGTLPNQQVVTGFVGKGLVNTFLGGDGPQGVLTSKSFTIERKYIQFLVGGGRHQGETCINLKVDGKVVRTRTGRDLEVLEPATWDVSDLRAKEAVLEIVDRNSRGWGHINIDQITFSDFSEEDALRQTVSKALPPLFDEVKAVREAGRLDGGPGGAWSYEVRLGIAKDVVAKTGFSVLKATPAGEPLMVSGPLGKGTVALVLADSLPWPWMLDTTATVTGTTLTYGEGLPPTAAGFGSMSLSTISKEATASTSWSDPSALAADLAEDGVLSGPERSSVSPPGETVNSALAVPLKLAPGEKSTVTFVVSWFFPNFEVFGHKGMMYSAWYKSAAEVGADVCRRLSSLSSQTQLYHDTVYESNLPYWFIDCFTSQTCIFRGPTCFWAKDHAVTHRDYFAGYEGWGCCPLNCTHVWNYAQSHARLFPELGRNLREYDFLVYLKESGETQHRQHGPHGAFIDGHCAVIEGAYREYLMSPDGTFLKAIWPGVKKATDWLITKIDPDGDGVNAGPQDNTYDCATSGAHTFIGSQYLSALAAAEKMARVEGDLEAAERYQKSRAAGTKNQDERLWNGEYYIQIPDPQPAADYNTGCHSDQLLGQWWAHMLDNGYLYPKDHVRTALDSIMKYNFRTDFKGFQQLPRRYVVDEEGGLLMCTWPKGGRPSPFIIYADEVWTGIEYAVAGLMIYEGQMENALRIVKTARDRYDGRLRPSLNSGPGGSPFNDLECGQMYSRALSSWGLLLAAQGYVYEGPKQRIGFRPNWKPEDHASFFTAAEGWGLFRQKRERASQSEEINVRWGKLPVRELLFQLPEGADKVKAMVHLDNRLIPVTEARNGGDIVLTLRKPVDVSAGQTLEVNLTW